MAFIESSISYLFISAGIILTILIISLSYLIKSDCEKNTEFNIGLARRKINFLEIANFILFCCFHFMLILSNFSLSDINIAADLYTQRILSGLGISLWFTILGFIILLIIKLWKTKPGKISIIACVFYGAIFIIETVLLVIWNQHALFEKLQTAGFLMFCFSVLHLACEKIILECRIFRA